LTLAKVAQPTWNGDVIEWTDISNEIGYRLKLYKNSLLVRTVDSIPADTISFDFSTTFISNGDGNYTVSVTALGNGETLVNGEESLESLANVKSTNHSPVVSLSFNEHITDLSNALNGSFGQTAMIYDGRFTDSDGDTLSYTFESSDDTIVTITDKGNGIVEFKRVSHPSSPVEITFKITADDGQGNTVADVFKVTIN